MAAAPTPYDAVPYRGRVVATTAPAHLHTCARWHGGPGLASPPHRVAELGCGDGANLIALAFYHPASTFVGVDNAPGELARAQARARTLGLANVRFLHCDIRDLLPDALGTCDVILAHGLYSWVPDDARDAIWRAIQRQLAPAGLAYVSYNAQPGWRTRQLVREALLRSPPVRRAPADRKADAAIELASVWSGLLPAGTAHTALLGDELARVVHGEPFYVTHEHLAATNDGFWLGDVVERAARHGLAYVADAQVGTWAGHVPAEVRDTLAGLSRVEREETADLLCNRTFHASIVCHADAPRPGWAPRDVLASTEIASSLGAVAEAIDLTEGVSEAFARSDRERGPTVTLEASVTKAAVAALAALWPLGLPLDALLDRATATLGQHGYAAQPDALDALADDLVMLVEAGQVDLRPTPSRPPGGVPSHPRAHALARDEAARGLPPTTRYHSSLALDTPARELVQALDGSRSLDTLRADYGAELVERALPALASWGLLSSPSPLPTRA